MKVLPVLEYDSTIEEQLEKIQEEVLEVIAAHRNNEGKGRVLEETVDAITACLTLAYKYGTDAEIDLAVATNFMKHKARGSKIKGLWEVTKV